MQGASSIDVHQLRVALEDAVPLFDVREPDEYEAARIPAAQLIPLGEVVEALPRFQVPGPVYVVCHSGGRSARAVAWLREQGIDAVNVEGGTAGWAQAGYPIQSGPVGPA